MFHVKHLRTTNKQNMTKHFVSFPFPVVKPRLHSFVALPAEGRRLGTWADVKLWTEIIYSGGFEDVADQYILACFFFLNIIRKKTMTIEAKGVFVPILWDPLLVASSSKVTSDLFSPEMNKKKQGNPWQKSAKKCSKANVQHPTH